eukprot:199477_1
MIWSYYYLIQACITWNKEIIWYPIIPSGTTYWQHNNLMASNNGESVITFGGAAGSNGTQFTFNNIQLNAEQNQIDSHNIIATWFPWNSPNMAIDAANSFKSDGDLWIWTPTGYTMTNNKTYILDSHYELDNSVATYAGMLVYDYTTTSFVNTASYDYTPDYISQETCVTNNNAYIFIVGGVNIKSGSTTWNDRELNNYLQIYDIENDKWTTQSDPARMKYYRYNAGCSFDKEMNHLYVFGGYEWETPKQYYSIEKYDVFNMDQWIVPSACSTDDIYIDMNSGTNGYYIGFRIYNDCCGLIVDVTIRDSGNYNYWFSGNIDMYTWGFPTQITEFTAPIDIKMVNIYGEELILHNIITSTTDASAIYYSTQNFVCNTQPSGPYFYEIETKLNIARARCQCILNEHNSLIYCIGGDTIINGNTEIHLNSVEIFNPYDETIIFGNNVSLTHASFYSTYLHKYAYDINILFLWNENGMAYTIFKYFPPTSEPTINPTNYPTLPTNIPTQNPTNIPTMYPTAEPTVEPTTYPSKYPTEQPSKYPTYIPTQTPTSLPIKNPTNTPTSDGMVNTVNTDTLETDTQSDNKLDSLLPILLIIIAALILIICICVFRIFFYKKYRKKNKMNELTKVTTTELTEVNTEKIQSQSVIIDEQCTNNNDTDTDEEMYVKHNDIETPMNANHGNHGMHNIKEGFYTIAIMDYMAVDEDQLNM